MHGGRQGVQELSNSPSQSQRGALVSLRLTPGVLAYVAGKLLAAENNLVVSADVREFVAETGDVRDAILELAEQEKVSAIVVGSRGLSAVKRFILGSTSSYLVTHAPCPVIVCRLKSDS